MVNIIKIAKILKARTITGNLAETDSDHFDKLEHFYIKHGFIVSISDSGKTGTVYLRMPCKTHSCEEKEGSIK